MCVKQIPRPGSQSYKITVAQVVFVVHLFVFVDCWLFLLFQYSTCLFIILDHSPVL